MATELVGRTIREVRQMTAAELAAESWDCPAWEQPVVLVLDDGTRIYPSRDAEANGPGALFGVDEDGAFAIAPATSVDSQLSEPSRPVPLLIAPDGRIRCLYDESIDLAALGDLTIARASHVEPDAEGGWTADLSPMAGPVLGPFPQRSDALRAERDWLLRHRLSGC